MRCAIAMVDDRRRRRLRHEHLLFAHLVDALAFTLTLVAADRRLVLDNHLLLLLLLLTVLRLGRLAAGRGRVQAAAARLQVLVDERLLDTTAVAATSRRVLLRVLRSRRNRFANLLFCTKFFCFFIY